MSVTAPRLGGATQDAWEHYVPLDPATMWDQDAPPRGVCEFGYWEFNDELKSNAKKATLASFWDQRYADPLDLAQRRLFRYPDADLSDTERTKAWAERHFNEPVGVLSESVYFDSQPWVGLLRGIRGGELGYGLTLATSPGSTQYCDWTTIIHVCMLPRHFRIWRWDA